MIGLRYLISFMEPFWFKKVCVNFFKKSKIASYRCLNGGVDYRFLLAKNSPKEIIDYFKSDWATHERVFPFLCNSKKNLLTLMKLIY